MAGGHPGPLQKTGDGGAITRTSHCASLWEVRAMTLTCWPLVPSQAVFPRATAAAPGRGGHKRAAEAGWLLLSPPGGLSTP